jgi:hypothetical protein
MRRRISPIVIALCTAIVGARVGFSKEFNALGQTDKYFNALGGSEGVPELQGFGGVALVTVLGAVGYGARKFYQKITRRGR